MFALSHLRGGFKNTIIALAIVGYSWDDYRYICNLVFRKASLAMYLSFCIQVKYTYTLSILLSL